VAEEYGALPWPSSSSSSASGPRDCVTNVRVQLLTVGVEAEVQGQKEHKGALVQPSAGAPVGGGIRSARVALPSPPRPVECLSLAFKGLTVVARPPKLSLILNLLEGKVGFDSASASPAAD
jgi:hypothetical protein